MMRPSEIHAVAAFQSRPPVRAAEHSSRSQLLEHQNQHHRDEHAIRPHARTPDLWRKSREPGGENHRDQNLREPVHRAKGERRDDDEKDKNRQPRDASDAAPDFRGTPRAPAPAFYFVSHFR